ncbi:MAG: phosphatidylserine decarboxylase family protein [Thermodesulfovibrionales bacterium]|nr:phosphatidylserine decarboxylase family protein [Thermodesulfovibrionales bacterium]
MRLASEGYPFIAIFAAGTIAALLIGNWRIALLPFIVTLFMLYFFRDPERKTPEGEGIFTAPADGKIILIRDIFESEHLKKDSKQISIFMSPLNVHVNRSPYNGKVKEVKHNKGRFLAAYKDDASLKNENIEMVLETKYGDILVRQVAGFIARRAVCRVKVGDSLNRGQRYGIIKFSSRLDVYLPKETPIKVKSGDRVKAGETIIGVIK